MHLTAVGQPLNANLTALAGLTLANNKGLYSTGAGALATYDLSAFGRTWGGLADASAARTALSLVPGTDVQAFDADLSALAGLSSTGMIARTGSGTAAVRTLTGTANQVSISNGDGVSGNPTFSLPQSIHTAATPTFAALTLSGASITSTNNEFNLLGAGLSGSVTVYPSGLASSRTARVRITTGNNPIATPPGGTEQHQLFVHNFAQVDSGSNYFNPSYDWGVIDASFNVASMYSLLNEGEWTNAGGTVESRIALYDYQSAHTIFFHQFSEPDVFNFGGVTDPVGLRIYGKTVNTAVNGTVGGIELYSTFTKNDSNTRQFSVQQILPTFNFGGSNTNTTVYGLHLDSTNTSTTGLTYYPLYVAYGGSARMSLSSAGLLALTGSQTISGDLTVDTNTLFVDSTNNRVGIGTVAPGVGIDYHTTSSTMRSVRIQDATNGPAFIMSKARGATAATADWRRAKSGDVLGSFSWASAIAADDSTAATIPGSFNGNIRAVALEDHTSTARGTQFDFATMATGTATSTVRAIIGQTGLTIGAATAARASTEPTNALNVVDGTAPVGAATNMCSFYSTSGEMRVMDAAGNATLLSPHDREGNWIHDEVNFKGRRLRVDLERMIKALNDMLGGGYVQESYA